MPRKKAVEEIYQKKSPREHVLLRPDTYVGSVERDRVKMFVMDEENNCMKEEEIEYVPALYKIFDEILVNAADNKQRDGAMREIRVKIDIDNGCIEVRNDGKGIPIEIHKEHNMYIPELIFGNLLTSSNYNDEDLKTVGGRNGFGAKLANIFSKRFVVETVDSEQRLKYKQMWTDNMSVKQEPTIDELSSKRISDYTKIKFYPDFARFGMESFANEDILKLFIKRVYDVAGTTSKDLNVYLKIPSTQYTGKTALKVKTFVDYTKLFIGKDTKSKSDYWHCQVNDKWEIVLAISKDNEYRQISHVNNIWTIKGGSHVKYIENQFIKYFKDNFKSKQNKIKEMLKPKMIRDHLFVFVNALIVNPAFSSQTKEVLTTKSAQFGSKCVIPEDIKKRLMTKIKVMVKELLAFKLDQAAKKTDGTRKRKMNFPPEINDANDAGGKHAAQCTLIVTEGLSAKTLAVAGITELEGQNNRYGIFPLKGKLLNVREAPRSQINKNTEITNLKQILGLKHGIKYNNKKVISSLRYGKVMIMTDQDYDGSHIKGLMINLFHSEWPDLIHNKLFGADGDESFVEQFITPIVVASKGSQKHAFYTVPQYEEWKTHNNDGKGWKIKYYKGLGSWRREDGKEHFKKLGKHRIAFKFENNEDDNSIIKAFSKDKADARKEWIGDHQEGTHLNYGDMDTQKVTYTDFIDKELILFSVNDLQRSVPSIFDGLKPGQRKILYCCFLKNNLKTELRVAQLGGYVSEKSAYHHGEQSLYQTIIGMAQDYVGSNNINLLSPNGMFGSRMKGGKDAASPRYIHTHLAAITRRIFDENDDMIVQYQEDDGYPVEPSNYLPIIPTVLVNGCKGIGTGWSTFIPNYNPSEIIKNIRRKLCGEECVKMHPYFRGFQGQIVCGNGGQEEEPLTYKTRGVAEIVSTFANNDGTQYSTIQVSELPVFSWTESYKKYLMDLEDAQQIENVNNMSSDIDVAFTFDIQHKERPTKRRNNTNANANTNSNSQSPQRNGAASRVKVKKKIYFNGSLDEQFLKDMKLISSMACSNMVLFDTDHKIKKYQKVEDILQEFYEARLRAYHERKKAMLASMEHELLKIKNQARFIMMVVDEELIIAKRKRMQVIADLRRHKFDVWKAAKANAMDTLRNRARATDAFEESAEAKKSKKKAEGATGYTYLLSMALSSLTEEKVNELLNHQEKTMQKVNALKQKSIKDLWRDDLNVLEQHLDVYHQTFADNIEEMRKEAQNKRNKAGPKTMKRKRKTKPKPRTKVKKESSASSTTTSSSINKGMKALTTKTKTKPKKKKKLLSNPFSMAKSAAKKKQQMMDFDDEESEESPTAHLSLFERANIKRNSPPKKRKRKRQLMASSDEEELELSEPPQKRRNTASTSQNSSALKSISINNNKNKKKKKKQIGFGFRLRFGIGFRF
eukprot:201633_1